MMCLKNKSDPGVAETGQFFVRKSKNISPINGNPSAVGFGKCSENVQKSRFTALLAPTMLTTSAASA